MMLPADAPALSTRIRALDAAFDAPPAGRRCPDCRVILDDDTRAPLDDCRRCASCYDDLCSRAGVTPCERCGLATDMVSDNARCYGGCSGEAHAFDERELEAMAGKAVRL